MRKFTCGGRYCRRTNIFAISVCLVTGVSLILLFQLSAVLQATPREGVGSLQTHYRHHLEMLSRQQDRDRGQSVESANRDLEERTTVKLNRVKSSSVVTNQVELTRNGGPSCPDTQEESRFREVVKGTLVYSAWFDDRLSQRYIRVLLLTSTRHPPPLYCHFESASKQKSAVSSASFYQHNENHNMQFGGYIASCIIPPALDSIPCFINISTRSTYKAKKESSDSVMLPVGFIDHQHSAEKFSRKQYGICIPPLHGEISVDRLIEFLELSQILGASLFTFYNFAASEEVGEVLNYYENKGLARVFSWNLPSYIGKYDIHYFGQTLSIMDCLFRSMNYLYFVAFNDLDEFIVPLEHNNMIALLEEIHQDEHCGHCFQSVIFDPVREDLQISPLLTQRVFHRTIDATPFWTKCVVNPRRIYEQGVHHISKPIEDNYVVNEVDWRIARVFHYRKCDDSYALMAPECSGVEEDKTMQKYGERLKSNFEITEAELNNFSTS